MQIAASEHVAKYRPGGGRALLDAAGCAATQPLFAVASSAKIFSLLGPFDLLALRLVDKASKALAEQQGPWKSLCQRELPGASPGASLTDAEAKFITTSAGSDGEPHHFFSWMAFYWQMWRLLSVEDAEGSSSIFQQRGLSWLRAFGCEPLRELPEWLQFRYRAVLENWLCIEVGLCLPGCSKLGLPASTRLVGRYFFREAELEGWDTRESAQAADVGRRSPCGLVRVPSLRMSLPSAARHGTLCVRAYARAGGQLVPVMRLTRCTRQQLYGGGEVVAEGALGGIAGAHPLRLTCSVEAPLERGLCSEQGTLGLPRTATSLTTPVELTELSISLRAYSCAFGQSEAREAADCLERYRPSWSGGGRGPAHARQFFALLKDADSLFDCSVCLEPGHGACAWVCTQCKKRIHLGCWRKDEADRALARDELDEEEEDAEMALR